MQLHAEPTLSHAKTLQNVKSRKREEQLSQAREHSSVVQKLGYHGGWAHIEAGGAGKPKVWIKNLTAGYEGMASGPAAALVRPLLPKP